MKMHIHESYMNYNIHIFHLFPWRPSFPTLFPLAALLRVCFSRSNTVVISRCLFTAFLAVNIYNLKIT